MYAIKLVLDFENEKKIFVINSNKGERNKSIKRVKPFFLYEFKINEMEFCLNI